MGPGSYFDPAMLAQLFQQFYFPPQSQPAPYFPPQPQQVADRPMGPLGQMMGQMGQQQPPMGGSLHEMLAPDNSGGLAGLIEEQRRARGLTQPQQLAPDAAAMQNMFGSFK